MTKIEAKRLEDVCDEVISLYLGELCRVSMALSGRLRIGFHDSGTFIILTKDLTDISYVNFTGDWDQLMTITDNIVKCIMENSGIFYKLLWSYEHKNELEED